MEGSGQQWNGAVSYGFFESKDWIREGVMLETVTSTSSRILRVQKVDAEWFAKLWKYLYPMERVVTSRANTPERGLELSSGKEGPPILFVPDEWPEGIPKVGQ